MRKRVIAGTFAAVLIAAVAALFFAWPMDPENSENAEAFENSVTKNCGSYRIVYLRDIAPFDWDRVYFFPPYMSKEKMFKTMGFKSAKVRETCSEGMLNIVFVKGDKVVCSMQGYSDKICISSARQEHSYDENPAFTVVRTGKENDGDSIVRLQYYEGELEKPIGEVASAMVGLWRCRQVSREEDMISEKYAEFVITNEGVLVGYMHCSQYEGKITIENLKDSQLVTYTGAVEENGAVAFDLAEKSFKLNFGNGMFSGDIKTDGKNGFMNGLWEFEKQL